MKIDFDYNYLTRSGYFVILVSMRGKGDNFAYFGYVENQYDNYKMIAQCNWDSGGTELKGRSEYDLVKRADE